MVAQPQLMGAEAMQVEGAKDTVAAGGAAAAGAVALSAARGGAAAAAADDAPAGSPASDEGVGEPLITPNTGSAIKDFKRLEMDRQEELQIKGGLTPG